MAFLFAARGGVKWVSETYRAESVPSRSPAQPPDSLNVSGWAGEQDRHQSQAPAIFGGPFPHPISQRKYHLGGRVGERAGHGLRAVGLRGPLQV